MYIWDDGESVTVTGSVNYAVLDAYNKAKDEGGDLSVFAPFLGVVPEPEPGVAEESAAPAPAEEVQDEETGVPAAYVKVEEVEYEDMSLAALTSLAEARGLPKYGTKADIAERLSENDAAETGTDEEQ
jgi:hypothetical protein